MGAFMNRQLLKVFSSIVSLLLIISMLVSCAFEIPNLTPSGDGEKAPSGSVIGGNTNGTGGATGNNTNDSTSNDGDEENGTGASGGETDGSEGGSSVCSHADTNKDRLCDYCYREVFVLIDFYAINDMHGKLFDSDNQPGADELTTYLKNAYETDEHVIILSSGDMWQGTAESNLTRGEMMTEWLNEVGAVSMTLGNHEFDWATEYIEKNLELADFPFLAINIYDTSTGKRVDYASSSVIVERGGAKIGIIGAIGDCYSSISGDRTVGIEFKTGNVLTKLVTEEAARLRSLGCDYIVYSIHDGIESPSGTLATNTQLSVFYDTVLSRGVVDLVFEAHVHQNYVLRDAYGVYHLQAGGENSAISHVEIYLNIDANTAVINEATNVSSYVYDDCASDDIVDELADKYREVIAIGDEHITTLTRKMYSSELAQLCADLYLAKGLELWGEEYNIVLAGGYIKTRTPYNLSAGTVLYKDIYSLFPFDNDLYLCKISGKKLTEQFLSGRSNYYIKKSNSFPSSIDPSGTYYIVADGYSVFYSYNGLTPVRKNPQNLYARDFIAEYLKKKR